MIVKFNKWDYTFMGEARLWASLSKDPSRKIGAVIARDRKSLASGFNGFPSRMEDRDEWLNNREEKYNRVIHAEMNAIHNALEHGIIVKNATIYVFGLPACSKCAINIIQAKIDRVVYVDLDSSNSTWVSEIEIASKYFKECGVSFEKMELGDLNEYFNNIPKINTIPK